MSIAKTITYLLFVIIPFTARSQKKYSFTISGYVKDINNQPISYASVFINAAKGTTADINGYYQLEVPTGKQTITCQYIGYKESSETIDIKNTNIKVNFILHNQEKKLDDIVIQSSKKDRSNIIIRNAIRMKPHYKNPLDSFTCKVYIKMQMQSRSVPKSLLFKKIDKEDKKEMGVDSNGKGMMYLSESITQYAFKKPNKEKLNIIAGRESGSNGYGFNFPTFIQFYNDNVEVLSIAGSRGYVSPLADAAFHYYYFNYIGYFEENGQKIHRIHLKPKRNYEPVFDGEIDITDGDWRIYNIDVLLTKKAQLQLLDTIRIQQQAAPIDDNNWMNNKMVLHFSLNMFGFNIFGSAINVYSDYDSKPTFPKNYFNNIVAQYQKNVNKYDSTYWDTTRPIQLTKEESDDYSKKDSSFKAKKLLESSKPYQDSIHRKREQLTIGKILWSGYIRGFRNDSGKTIDYISFQPLLPRLQYNTVEGISLNSIFSWTHQLSKNTLTIAPHLRYGFSNGHFNPELFLSLQKRKDSTQSNKSYQYWTMSGGKRLSQYNNANPISPLMNEVYTLFWAKNFMKLYENYYTQITFAEGKENGFAWNVFAKYEDRMYVANSTDYSFNKTKHFTDNYPVELSNIVPENNKAFIVGFGLRYQPGQKYIQYPNYIASIGSKSPTFSINYQKGIQNILGSTVDFDKWNAGISNANDFKLGGKLNYKINIGGFLNKKNVALQDYQHFNGNQTLFATEYINSFQLAPYYANSTVASFYTTAHMEHHFNGMLTNKIPLFKKLNWNLVAGSNAFYVNSSNNYIEAFAGLENIFKIYRVDFVQSFLNGNKGQFGVRIGIGGIFTNSLNQ